MLMVMQTMKNNRAGKEESESGWVFKIGWLSCMRDSKRGLKMYRTDFLTLWERRAG